MSFRHPQGDSLLRPHGLPGSVGPVAFHLTAGRVLIANTGLPFATGAVGVAAEQGVDGVVDFEPCAVEPRGKALAVWNRVTVDSPQAHPHRRHGMAEPGDDAPEGVEPLEPDVPAHHHVGIGNGVEQRLGPGGTRRQQVTKAAEPFRPLGVDPADLVQRPGSLGRVHPRAGTTKEDAEKLARRLAKDLNGPNDRGRSLSFGAYLTHTWLPAKRLELKTSTWDGYRRNVHRHVLPALGSIPIRRLRVSHLEDLYESKLHPTDGQRALSPKTVLEIHLVIRGALNEAVRRGILSRNVALVAKAPRLRSIEQVEPTAWTAEQPRTFLRAAAGHRLFPALWTSAMTGMRRSELLGLRWTDLDIDAATISVNRGLIAVAYEVHEETNLATRPGVSRGKTRNARRRIDLDPTTIGVLTAWQAWQRAEQEAVGIEDLGWMFTDASGAPVHPHAISQTFERIVRRAAVPIVRLHDLRHTHATLLIDAGVPAKVVSERLGHARASFTIEAYQHVHPPMQAEAAQLFAEHIANPASTGTARWKRRKKSA